MNFERMPRDGEKEGKEKDESRYPHNHRYLYEINEGHRVEIHLRVFENEFSEQMNIWGEGNQYKCVP